jgi:hypothetical protein
VAGKASWKPFAHTQETVGNDDDDIMKTWGNGGIAPPFLTSDPDGLEW